VTAQVSQTKGMGGCSLQDAISPSDFSAATICPTIYPVAPIPPVKMAS
jgi:hypothetical protein